MRERGLIIGDGVVWGSTAVKCVNTLRLSRLMKASDSKSKILRVFSLGVLQ